MDCTESRRMISRLIDGEIEEEERDRLLRHLEGCMECSGFHRFLCDLGSVHADLEEADPPGEMLGSILEMAEGRGRIAGWKKMMVYAAAAVIILTGAGIGSFLAPRDDASGDEEFVGIEEIRYLDPYPPGSIGEKLLEMAEGEADV